MSNMIDIDTAMICGGILFLLISNDNNGTTN